MQKHEFRERQIIVFTGLVIKDGKILIVQRDEEICPDAHLKWELPGGKIDFGETPQESVEREIQEETGIKVRAKNLLPRVQVSYWNYPWGRQQTLVFCFECDYIEELTYTGDHHVKAVSWVSTEELGNLQTIPGTNEFLREATDKQ